MSQHPFRRFLASLAVAIAWIVPSRPVTAAVDGPSRAERELEASVRELYGASRKALSSVQCDYTFTLNGNIRQCRYRRDAERLYHAGAGILPGRGVSMPDEVAWDGQQAFHRVSLQQVSLSAKRDSILESCPPPECAAEFINQALGILPPQPHRYQLISARDIQWDSKDCVELNWRVEDMNRTLRARHARSLGYWPVSVTLQRDDGSISYDMTQVRYTAKDIDGNAVFYPVFAVFKSDPDKPSSNVEVWEVDENTLKIGDRIAADDFRIEFWPCDSVTHFERGLVRAAQDPKWSPRGHAKFPWDMLLDAVDRAKAIGGPTAQQDSGRTTITPDPPSPVRPLAALPPAHERLLFWLLPAGGVLLVGVGAYWYRQRKRTA